MDVDVNERIDKKVKGILKGTELGEKFSNEDEEQIKYAVIDPLYDLLDAAKESYCEGDDMILDDVLDCLIEAFTKMKGKEKELRKIAATDQKEDAKAGGEAHPQKE